MPSRPFYYRETHGIRVTVRPRYLADQSLPDAERYVFAYFVRIENVGAQAAQLRSRRWMIHDSIGEELEEVGDGVVGQQPRLETVGVHEYSSFCVLKSPRGHMEGQYRFARDDGSRFEAQIPRFELDAEAAEA